MSSFKCKVKIKSTGEIVEAFLFEKIYKLKNGYMYQEDEVELINE